MLDADDPFPCIFGIDAVRRGSLRYTFVFSSHDATSLLVPALTEFVETAATLGKRTSLVAFFETVPASGINDYYSYFWNILQTLHESDQHPWPIGIPLDPDANDWEFCFSGMPMFVVANTPGHLRRRSRYFDHFAITFQPRFVFDGLDPASPQGANARKIIRNRLRSYDTVAQTPLLGSFGEEGNREWVQYFLHDDNDQGTQERCPFLTKIGRVQ